MVALRVAAQLMERSKPEKRQRGSQTRRAGKSQAINNRVRYGDVAVHTGHVDLDSGYGGFLLLHEFDDSCNFPVPVGVLGSTNKVVSLEALKENIEAYTVKSLPSKTSNSSMVKYKIASRLHRILSLGAPNLTQN